MKKSKLKMGLITSFICGMALTGCDGISSSEKNVVDFNSYSGSELSLLTDNMYSEYLETSAGLTKYYEKVRDLLVRATFKAVTEDANGLKVKEQLATLEYKADNKVDEQKENARKNAKNNDTSYSDELDAIFESYNVEDEEGLKEHFLLDLEKEQLDSAIMNNDAQLKILRDGDTNEKGWLNSAKPYHIKHMLVKIEGGADNFTRATITEDEATKLAKIVTLLGAGEKFDDLAANNLLNDDSSDKLGDVGIVNNNATTKSLKMVSEFQLGIYTGDVLANDRTTADGIGLDATVKADGVTEKTVKDSLRLIEVPYGAFLTMSNVAKYPEAKEDSKIKDVNACVYPRNVIWNKYFNNHNVFVISNKEAKETLGDNYDFVEANVDSEIAANPSLAARFNAKGYLTADDGKVILGVRSEYGVHFIKIQKSAYDADLDKYYPIALNVDGVDVTAATPGSNYIVGLDNAKDTYDTRLSDIKSAIKGYDSNSEYRLYNYLVSYAKANNILKVDAGSNTEAILNKIDNHIKDLKDAEVYKQEDGLKTVWENYLKLIKLQDTKRSEVLDEGYFYDITNSSGLIETKYADANGETTRSALVPMNAALAYLDLCVASTPAEKAAKLKDFVEGGKYYYGK